MMATQLALPVDSPPEVLLLRDQLNAEWPAIQAALQNASSARERLQEGLVGYVPPDTSFVVYGSLARGEFTSKSDLDWTLLVDGPADPAHQQAELAIAKRLVELKFKEPGPVGTFGGLTFSHDLLHKIGGDDDTNRNTTQRILLLLESVPIGDRTSYRGVVRNVLRRYIEEDYLAPGESPFRVPRFLQNDVARYWRTMAVDFAQKRRERGGRGWALRTVKLQMSRKLMYTAGLLSCFSCKLELENSDPVLGTPRVVSHLEELVRKTPLDIVAGTVLRYFGELSGPARDLFTAYDEFLALLADSERRDHLDRLPPGADDDLQFKEARAVTKRFQQALTTMFFDRAPLSELTKLYGVF
jgi:hypothetical protein